MINQILGTIQPITLENLIKIINDPRESESCDLYHEGISCNRKMLRQFIMGSISIGKMYLVAHIIHFFIFKRKQFKEKYEIFYSVREHK